MTEDPLLLLQMSLSQHSTWSLPCCNDAAVIISEAIASTADAGPWTACSASSSPKGESDMDVESTVSGVSGFGGHRPDSNPLGGQCPFSSTITASNSHAVHVCICTSSSTMPLRVLGGAGPDRAGLLDAAPATNSDWDDGNRLSLQ